MLNIEDCNTNLHDICATVSKEMMNKPKVSHLNKQKGSRRHPMDSLKNAMAVKCGRYSAGKWTSEEHNMLLFALEILGNQWLAIQLFLGTRTGKQIRSHVQKYFSVIRRREIKKLRRSNQLAGKIFVVTKQYRNYPNSCMLSKAVLRKVEEMKKMWFSLIEKKSGATCHVEQDLKGYPDYYSFQDNSPKEDIENENMKEMPNLKLFLSQFKCPIYADGKEVKSDDEQEMEHSIFEIDSQPLNNRQVDQDGSLGEMEFHNWNELIEP